jgi:hypothetical protein
MRKIQTYQDKKRREKINRTIVIVIGVILIMTMLLSTIGFGFLNRDIDNGQNQGNEVNYQGVIFQQGQGGFWFSEKDGNNLITYYNALETENIDIEFDYSLEDINGKTIYYTQGNNLAIGEISRNLEMFMKRLPQRVCLLGSDCKEEDLVKNCSDNVIVFNENNVENTIKIYKDKNCVFINSTYENQVKAIDRLVFEIFDVQ